MDSLRLTRDNPWPGLESYDEASAEFFKGRNAEREDLLRLIRRAPLAVLYGQSGLGKTSLLQAGVFPQLRQEDLLPVYIRLDFGPDSPTLATQVRDRLWEAACANDGEATPPTADESLWSWLHRRDTEFWSNRNRLLTPMLVFDQFEELFTLGRGAADTRAFLAALACLVENRPPAALQAACEHNPALAERYDFRAQHYRILFASREDFLPDFEGLRWLMPSIAHPPPAPAADGRRASATGCDTRRRRPSQPRSRRRHRPIRRQRQTKPAR
ncbi:MAG: ATP-binding protein [Candidatus Methylumidiphilus sp.]